MFYFIELKMGLLFYCYVISVEIESIYSGIDVCLGFVVTMVYFSLEQGSNSTAITSLLG